MSSPPCQLELIATIFLYIHSYMYVYLYIHVYVIVIVFFLTWSLHVILSKILLVLKISFSSACTFADLKAQLNLLLQLIFYRFLLDGIGHLSCCLVPRLMVLLWMFGLQLVYLLNSSCAGLFCRYIKFLFVLCEMFLARIPSNSHS